MNCSCAGMGQPQLQEPPLSGPQSTDPAVATPTPTPTPTPDPSTVPLAPSGPSTTQFGPAVPLPNTTLPSNGQAGMRIVNAQAGDAALLQQVGVAMQKSPTAVLVRDRLNAIGAQVQFVPAAQLPANSQASYSSKDNIIFLQRELATADPEILAVQLAHEGVHAIHDPYIDAGKAKVIADMASQTNPQAFVDQKMAEYSLATETEAHMVEARVGLDMGLKVQGGTHVAVNADGSFRRFGETWEALQKDTSYNPLGLQLQPFWYQEVLTDVQ